jgi:hypothetical protein
MKSAASPARSSAAPGPLLVHSTSPAPTARRASVAGGAEEPPLARRVRRATADVTMHMQHHVDDGRARDPGGSPFACESSCARPRERRAVGARPLRASRRGQRRLLHPLAKERCRRRLRPDRCLWSGAADSSRLLQLDRSGTGTGFKAKRPAASVRVLRWGSMTRWGAVSAPQVPRPRRDAAP